MRRGIRFIAALLVGLGLLTWATSSIVRNTLRGWSEKDMNLRAQLAVTGARQALVSHWRKEQRSDLQELLSELARDERITAACACASDLTLLAKTSGFPAAITCEEVGARMRAAGRSSSDVAGVASFSDGELHIAAIPVRDGQQELGFVILAHDLGFVHLRQEKTQEFILLAFGFLAIAASAVTAMAARLSWRSWTNELRRFLMRTGGETPRAEFQPILRDVRELVDRIAAEKDSDLEGGAWTPERLKLTLNRHLHGEKVVILANREPYVHERTEGSGGQGSPSRQRPGDGARTRDARVFGHLDCPRQRFGRPGIRRPPRTVACAPGRRIVHHPAHLAHRRGGEGVLLRFCQRRALAPLSHRSCPPCVSQRRLGSISSRQPEVR